MMIKIRIYPSCLYFLLEKWLKEMSSRGWILVYRKWKFIYSFEKDSPKEKEFFVWDSTYTGEGKYSISTRYPLLEKKYGVSHKYSKINSNSFKKKDTIIELDINDNNEKEIKDLKNVRNLLYMRRFIRNLLIFIVYILVVLLYNILLS